MRSIPMYFTGDIQMAMEVLKKAIAYAYWEVNWRNILDLKTTSFS